MAESALAGVFREFTLTHSAPTGEWGTDPVTGNPVPVVEQGELVINFKASESPQLVFLPGADPKVVKGKGRCIRPASLPTALGIGSELPMTWAGRPGKLRIVQVGERLLEVVDQTLGQSFIAEWRAT